MFDVIGFRLTITKYAPLIEAWKKINHANIVQLKDVFITKAFNDSCECPCDLYYLYNFKCSDIFLGLIIVFFFSINVYF